MLRKSLHSDFRLALIVTVGTTNRKPTMEDLIAKAAQVGATFGAALLAGMSNTVY